MNTLILIVFIFGYLAIAFEHYLRINKTAPALIAGVLCWTIYIIGTENKELVDAQLLGNVGEFAGILFFRMGAMTIVEIIDLPDGFIIITRKTNQKRSRKLFWIIAVSHLSCRRSL